MYSGSIVALYRASEFISGYFEKYYISTLHAAAVKRKYRNWIRHTVNNENIKTRYFQNRNFLAILARLQLSGGCNRSQSQCMPLNSARIRTPMLFDCNFRREPLNLKRFAASHFARGTQTFGDAHSWQCTHVFCTVFHFGHSPLCKIIKYILHRVIIHARKAGKRQRKKGKEKRVKQYTYTVLQRSGDERSLYNDLIYNLTLVGSSSLFLHITSFVLSKFLPFSPCFTLPLVRSCRLLPVYSYFSCFRLSRDVYLDACSMSIVRYSSRKS